MKTEIWNGHEIRFVEKNGQWWAVAQDITDALGFAQAKDGTKKMPDKYKGRTKVPTTSGKSKCPETQEMIVLNEKGLYRLIMRSNKPEAEAFQDWVYDILKTLREASGLEGFEVFKMLDREHQRKQMEALCRGLKRPVQVDFIKANTIANKAISNQYGYPKMVKKADMTPQMLADREPVLEDTVQLMTINDRYGLNVSVSEVIYRSVEAKQPA
ncbi:MAG: Bro-N domain-containing protein [Candidatus Limiplasma sp.]|nr:Bro-N domain-containing protein [Candidatus Limiplasma sp.]